MRILKPVLFYSACQEKYEKTPGVRVVSHDIELRRAGDSLYMKSHLVLVNEGKYPCSTFTFYLNRFESRFVVGRLSTGCFLARRTDSFDRSKSYVQGIVPSLQLEYSGKIDERICYLDVADDVYSSFKKISGGLPYRFARCYAYVGDDFMLLTPEYLVSGDFSSGGNVTGCCYEGMYFTRYTLRVVGEKIGWSFLKVSVCGKRIPDYLMQGHALPALSVCMGNYERKYLKDAGTLYEIYCFKGHDFFPLISRERKLCGK